MTNDKATGINQFKPADDNFEFLQFPFYWIAKVANRYAHKMEIALKKVDMNITSWRVIMILKQHGVLSITDIASHAASRLPTITKMVYKMQDKGLVVVKPKADDGRVSEVTITKKGLENVKFVINNTTRIFDSAFKGMTEAQVRKLNSTLQKLFLNLSDE